MTDTQTTIEQVSETIARFDGWEEFEPGKDQWFKTSYDTRKFYQAHEFEYHSDWNRLHEVWKKLYPILLKGNMEFIEPMITAMVITSDISEAHRILYEAILWYQSLKQ